MNPAGKYEYMITDMGYRYGSDASKTVGILIANPDKTFVKDEILNNIEYANSRSGLSIDFFFAGYSKYDTYDEQQKIIKAPKGKDWYFSVKMFTDFIEQLEQKSRWEYSGETELLLLEFKNGNLCFDKVMHIWIDKVVQEESVYSASYLFENIYRIARKKMNTDTDEFSDRLGIRNVRNSFFDIMLGFLNEAIRDAIRSTSIYAVKNYSISCLQNVVE